MGPSGVVGTVATFLPGSISASARTLTPSAKHREHRFKCFTLGQMTRGTPMNQIRIIHVFVGDFSVECSYSMADENWHTHALSEAIDIE
jgi:hypothetical protein